MLVLRAIGRDERDVDGVILHVVVPLVVGGWWLVVGERSVDGVRLVVTDELVGKEIAKATLLKERAVLVCPVLVTGGDVVGHDRQVDANGDLSHLSRRFGVSVALKTVHTEVPTEGTGDSGDDLLGGFFDVHGCLLGVGGGWR